MSDWKGPLPCKGCGGPKPRGPGKRFCDPCRDRLRPLVERAASKRRGERDKEARRLAGKARNFIKDAPAGTKWCPRCQEFISLRDFGTKGGGRLAAYCRPCASNYLHERSIATQFGLTVEDYERLLDLQGGRCAICERKPRTRRLAVDHDHDSGEIRGLLCTRCNHKLLGAANESGAMLRRAATYLEHPPAVTNLPVPAADDDLMALRIEQWAEENEGRKFKTTLWLKRKGKSSPLDGYVCMSGDTFLRLLEEIR